MKNLIVVLLFPLVSFCQSNQYFILQTEIDARNALFGGTVNERGYNGVFKAGFSAQWFRSDVFYETFSDLKYRTAGVNLTHLFNYDRAFKQGAGIQISVIDKPKKLTPSLGLNGILEYHFSQFFVSARAETKMRTDWDITVYSGFVGVGIKL
jgi:hypothetical protein